MKNYCISVRESGEDIVFLRKIVPGGADKSYGIQVARLAGVPDEVIARAMEISGKINSKDAALFETGENEKNVSFVQMELPIDREDDAIRKRLLETDISRITPLEALNILDELKRECKG